MVGQSSENRFTTFNFWRDFASTSYVFSLIALFGFGISMDKPAATNSALAMSLCSVTRKITQQISERPLRQEVENLQLQKLGLQGTVQGLNHALRENWEWHEKYKTSQHEQEVSRNQIRELEQSCETIRFKWKEAESANQEFQIEEAKWKVRLSEYQKPLQAEIDRLKDVCKRLQQDYRNSVDELNALTESHNQLIAKYDGLARENTALRAPRRLPEATPEQVMANRIADWLGQLKPAITAHVTQPAKINGEDWIIWIDLEGKNAAYRVKEHDNFIRMDFGLPNTPTIKADGDRVKITIHRGERLDEYGVMRTDPMWLKDALVFEEKGRLFAHHARFSGESRSGKSTIISNAVGMLRMTIPQIQIDLADPHTKGQSNWKSLTPTYKGKNDCLRGFQEFYQEFKRWDSSEEENPTPRLFILDEFDGMSKEYPEIVANAVDLWKNGRHEQFYLWVVGQSAGVGRFNSNQKPSERMYLEDVKNLIQFWLADAIDRGLSEVNEQPIYKSAMRQAWLDARAKGQRFIALCRPITVIGRSFIALMPPEGYFQAGAKTVKEVLEEADEENYLENRRVEFETGAETIDHLNRLFDLEVTPNDPASKPKFEVTQKQLKAAKQLLDQGLKPHEIVFKVWSKKRGNGKAYQFYKEVVLKLINPDEPESA